MEREHERVRLAREVDYGELPELTRGLRALGSSRVGAGSLQSLFFHSLLDARRRAAEARSAVLCLRAFDAAELGRALERAVERIVLHWPDEREPARRALRAELRERVRPFSVALAALSDRAAEAQKADEPARLAAWREWTAQLTATFVAADQCWIAIRPIIDRLPAASR